MTPHDLIAAFKTVADAPEGVARLRELVLELAVRGRLVPQDPNDEPASVLLDKRTPEPGRTAATRARRRSSDHSTATDFDVPFQLPSSWTWYRLDQIAAYNGRPNRAPGEVAPNTWVLDLEDIEKTTSRLLTRARIDERESKSTKSSFKKGDVLYGKLRPYLDKVLVADEDGVCTTEIVPIVPRPGVDAHYLQLSLKRPDFIENVTRQSYGMKMPRLGTSDAEASHHPIPPLAEQHRIVARVDELMGLLNRLEAAHNASHGTRTAARDAALAALREAADPDQVETAWTRVSERLNDLCLIPEDVPSLRQAVLELAVRNRLVTQDPKDEPESVPTAEGYAPAFSVPPRWQWSSLGRICRFIDYRGRTPTKTSHGTRLITAKNVRMGFLKDDPLEFIDDRAYANWMTRGLLRYGDVLFTTEAPLGNVAQLLTREKIALAQRIITMQPVKEIDPAFLKTALMSPGMQDSIRARATGTTAQGIKAAKLKLIPLPVPPLAEQHRIVARVDELMGLLDRLERHLREARVTQAAFAAAAIHDLDA